MKLRNVEISSSKPAKKEKLKLREFTEFLKFCDRSLFVSSWKGLLMLVIENGTKNTCK